MGTALSTIKPPKMPPEPKQEPLLSFVRRWEKKLGASTDGKQKPATQAPTAQAIREEKDDFGLSPSSSSSPEPQSLDYSQSSTETRSGSESATKSGASGSGCLLRRSSRAATKLKIKAHAISSRIAKRSRGRSQPGMENEFVKHRNCALQVANLFPDISPQHLQELASSLGHDATAVINFIADELEAGRPYPKRPSGAVKRKRGDDNEGDEEDDDEVGEEMARVKRRFDSAGRRAVKKSPQHAEFISKLIVRDFPFAPLKYVKSLLAGNDQLLLPTYLELEDIVRGWDKLAEKPWVKNFDATRLRAVTQRQEAELERALERSDLPQPYREELEEMQAARLVRSFRDKMRKEKEDKVSQPQQQPQAGGDDCEPAAEVVECQCCFDEQPMAGMIHCNGEEAHFFCIACARRNAENEVGLSRYELTCMAMESCSAGFAHTQRQKFLDKNLTAALDRIEANYMISLAALEDLAKCPFCNYAAEYPPIEENKIFECLDRKCLKRSCRLCNKEDHLPQTCEEFTKENGLNARRAIEEARSEAVIRRCNKCNNPFIKEMGCNKMTCPVSTCGNVQCYICSKSCGYDHFNRESGCVLYDNIETRHEGDLRKAEEVARQKILEQNPDISDEQLRIEMSSIVKGDDDKRRARDVHQAGGADIYYEDWRARRQLNGGAVPYHPPPPAAPVVMDVNHLADMANRLPDLQLQLGQAPLAAPQLNQLQHQANRGNHQGNLNAQPHDPAAANLYYMPPVAYPPGPMAPLNNVEGVLAPRLRENGRAREQKAQAGNQHAAALGINDEVQQAARRIRDEAKRRQERARKGAARPMNLAQPEQGGPQAQEPAAKPKDHKKPHEGAHPRTRAEARRHRELANNALEHGQRQGQAPANGQEQQRHARHGLLGVAGLPAAQGGAQPPAVANQPLQVVPGFPVAPNPGALGLEPWHRFREWFDNPDLGHYHPPGGFFADFLDRAANAPQPPLWDVVDMAARRRNLPGGGGRGAGGL